MNRLFETSSEELVDDGNNLYLCGMKKLLCPQCKIAAMYVKNEQGERLLVYVLENGEVVPKYPEDSMEGFDLTEVFCLGCSWHGSPKRKENSRVNDPHLLSEKRKKQDSLYRL